jgi:predicted aminopeptidase
MAVSVLVLAGCADVGYLMGSAQGHLAMMRAARPISELLADPAIPDSLKGRLEKAAAIRAYATRVLGLPDNASYRSYADVHRPYAVWNVVAAPELSLQPKTWCFPVTGCVSYRGYFRKEDAESQAESLRREGWDVQVAGIPAYSTLGWFDDPLLNTFIAFPDPELARLIFHELTHQAVYAPGDSAFNEGLASAVEVEGVERWLTLPENAPLRESWQAQARRRREFLALLAQTRSELQSAYSTQSADDEKRRRKAEILSSMKSEYARLKAGWGGYAGYDRWFDQPLGNAHLAAFATYAEHVPAFRAMIRAAGGDMRAFLAEARRVSKLSANERDALISSRP